MRRRIACIVPPRAPACAPRPVSRAAAYGATLPLRRRRDRTATDVARLPARRLRRTWARCMCRKTARALPPGAPACAPGELRGRVWRDPAVASAARCRIPPLCALPCPTNPPRARSARPVSGPSLDDSQPAPLVFALGGPQSIARGWTAD